MLRGIGWCIKENEIQVNSSNIIVIPHRGQNSSRHVYLPKDLGSCCSTEERRQDTAPKITKNNNQENPFIHI